MEQQEYSSEGVNVSVITVRYHFPLPLSSCSLILFLQFVDNSPTLELLERKGAGILSLLDDEINVPKGTDDTLINKIFKTLGTHPSLKR
jgi:hypothetical protein